MLTVYSKSQGWEFAQIAQIKWATVSDSLRLLRISERLWANRSGRSCQKSDSLRLPILNEQMSKSLIFSERIAHLLFRSQKTSDSLKKIWLKSYFLYVFFKISDSLLLSFLWAMLANCSCCSLKMSDVSESLRSLTKNERMSESLVFWANRLCAHFFRWANSQPWLYIFALKILGPTVTDTIVCWF